VSYDGAMSHSLRLAFAFSLVATVACGDDPVAVSSPVGLTMKTKSDDAKDGTISEEKNITTESGNPWGAFVKQAEDELGGPPGDIELDRLTILLAASSTGVTELRQVFAGAIAVQFELEKSNNLVTVGSGSIGESDEGREFQLTPAFDYGDLGQADRANLLGGGFKVILGGAPAAGFADLGADAEFQLTLRFSAYE
jgi:hypothetical protein